jgi:HEPN domain-containing protein
MQPLTLEWISKAEGDYVSANREMRARRLPNYDAACFHAQQCAEKYLKALLQEAGTPFGRTHNLVGLLDLLVPADPSWEMMRADLVQLSNYAVLVRYPGANADKSIARQAVALAQMVRTAARAALALIT